MTTVRYASTFAVSPNELFEFHRDTSNLARISPPIPRVAVEGGDRPTQPGDRHAVVMRLGPFSQRWEALVTRVETWRLVEDIQEAGPFRAWRHQHRVIATAEGATLEDRGAFRLLPTTAGAFVEWLVVRPALLAMFAYRHRKTRTLLEGAVR